MKKYSTVLSIAGSDSSGGAGIQADIKTISACGCYAMTAITAITAQNTCGVSDIHTISANMVAKQIISVADDIEIDAVKIGMLPTAEIAEVTAELLIRYNIKNIVVDPVMVATSGDRLISENAIKAIVKKLFPIATLITPNIPEATFLTGKTAITEQSYMETASCFEKMGAKNILIKSGHLEGTHLNDYLYIQGECHKYRYKRIETNNTHGTGCTLSSSIASFLALGYHLEDAVEYAENYIHDAIVKGASYDIGKGHGPVHHFFKFWE